MTATSDLQQLIGVSRVARVTGLDRSGIEVACAVRPGGHVLQVSNGKGLRWAEARAGALSEAAELWAAEHPEPQSLRFASRRELQAQGAPVWAMEGELLAPQLWSPELRCAWMVASVLGRAGRGRARSSADGEQVLVPAACVHCVPATGPWLGPALHRWTSNGMGAHPEPELALRHALLEAAERDGLARALPESWTPREVRRRKLSSSSLQRTAPQAAALVEQLASRGLTAHLFDLRPELAGVRWLGLPLAGALLVDDEGGPIPLTAGYACALERDSALCSALLEAAQSRLTDVHGAREDVEADGARLDTHAPLRELAHLCARTGGTAEARALPRRSSDSPDRLAARFARIGTELAFISLLPFDAPLAVIKVLGPGLLLSELL